jgi:hypothetical protein
MTHPPGWTAEQSRASLSALTNIATLHGTTAPTPEEQQLLDGARINILKHPEITAGEANLHLHCDELAAAVVDTEHRKRVAQLIALMPYASRPFSDNKLYISEKYLEALGENMHRLEDFIGARQKHQRNLEYCALRKLGRDVFPFMDEKGEYQEIMKLLKESEGDPGELARYQSLAGYPEETLGRAFHDFYAQFDWPLPGDPLWISEDLTVRHDLVHVICDYDISINGEFQVSAFTAGNSEQFNWMIGLLGFTPPYVSTGEAFRPADFLEAYRRGENATRSLVDVWDFWPEMARPLADLREEYQV